ncbi:MAG: outer membrane lipoprotein carrier protein LolA [Desulfobacterales bacterium]|nr:outer membrane lipoprotein carrier protein LolA [Desulfobacterales bacterium]
MRFKIILGTPFRVIFLILLFLFLSQNTFSADIDTFLSDVEKNMSSIQTVQTSFIQKKHMAMFDMPIIIKGKIFIQNPNKFAWVVTEPIVYTLIISKDEVKKWDASSGIQVLSLNENPMFKAMIEQITFWFSGSYASCKNDYDIKLLVKEPGVLEFTPKKHNPASQMLSSITLQFQNDKKYISKIKLFEKNKDSTEILFTDVLINSKIADSVWELN